MRGTILHTPRSVQKAREEIIQSQDYFITHGADEEAAMSLHPMEIHLQCMEETHAGAGGCLRGGCEPVADAWKEKPMAE